MAWVRLLSLPSPSNTCPAIYSISAFFVTLLSVSRLWSLLRKFISSLVVTVSTQAYQAWVRDNKPEGRLPGLGLSVDQLFFVGFARVRQPVVWLTLLRFHVLSIFPPTYLLKLLATVTYSGCLIDWIIDRWMDGLFVCLFDCLTVWLIDWSYTGLSIESWSGWLIQSSLVWFNWLTRLPDWLTDWLIDWALLADSLIDRLMMDWLIP